jgi:hypothetical protein
LVDLDGKVHQARRKLCTKIEGREKLQLTPKLDKLWKHNDMKKTLITIPRVFRSLKSKNFIWGRSFFTSRINVCMYNQEWHYNQSIYHGPIAKWNKKMVQFVVSTWPLVVDLWLVMKIWENSYSYLIKKISKIHWSNTIGWALLLTCINLR